MNFSFFHENLPLPEAIPLQSPADGGRWQQNIKCLPAWPGPQLPVHSPESAPYQNLSVSRQYQKITLWSRVLLRPDLSLQVCPAVYPRRIIWTVCSYLVFSGFIIRILFGSFRRYGHRILRISVSAPAYAQPAAAVNWRCFHRILLSGADADCTSAGYRGDLLHNGSSCLPVRVLYRYSDEHRYDILYEACGAVLSSQSQCHL